jgi:two-component system, NtrC family, sensor kinase
MRRRGKADGKTIKAQRRKALTRRVAPEGISSPSNRQETNIARELHEARDQQMATAEILRVIRTSPNDVQPVFETIVRNAVSLCGGLFANVFRFDGELLHYVASHNVGPSYADMIRAKYPMRPDSSQVSGRVVLTKSVVWLEDALTDPDYDQRFPVAMGWRRLLGVPMLREGEPIGAIGVGWAEPGPASKVQEELLKTFADQAVIAIENTRLLNELRESLQQQTAAADVLKVISRSANDVQPVFETIARSAVDLCGATYGIVFRYDGELITMAAYHNLDHAALEALNQIWPMRPDNRTVMGRTILQRNVVHIPDAESEPSLTFAAAHKAALGVRTYLGVPMLRNGNPIGAIALFRREVSLFSERQIELVKAFAAQAVIAIENTRLLNELRESLQQQTATADVLKVISSSPGELTPVFEVLLANATRLCEASYGNMWLCEGEDFRTAALHGPLPPAFLEKWQPGTLFRPGPEIPSVRAAKTRQPVQIADLRSYQAYLDGDPLAVSGVEEAGMRTMVAVPMLRENEPVGVIVIYRKEVRLFTDKQIDLVSNFAAQAVIAIENTRLLNELRESLRQQTATADVLKVISRSTFDLNAVLHALVETATQLCDADHGNISRERDGVYQRVATYGYTDDFAKHLMNLPVIPDRGTATGRSLLEGKVVHIRDVRADPEYTFEEAQKRGDFRTVVSVPMLREGTTIGILALTRREVRPFAEKQIDLIRTFADQAAIAIENVRLFESVEARTRELATSLEDLRTTQDRLVQPRSLPYSVSSPLASRTRLRTRSTSSTISRGSLSR